MALASASVTMPPRALYSPKETETILNVSHATCYRLIAAGKLDARKLGGKTLITAESIERLVTELPKVGRQE
jgi:excisionase family DNA binding protein